MYRIAFSCTLLLALFVSMANADIIYLKNGNRIEVQDAEIKGEMVVFSVFQGQMSIALSAVARVEKTSTAPRADAGLVNSIKGTPAFRTSTSTESGDAAGEVGQESGTNNAARQEMLRAYINQRQQLERELRLTNDQIQTLRGTIYAKSAIFSDTAEDRTRLQQFEQRKGEIEDELQQLMNEIRRAGFSPGEMRQISGSGQNQPGNVTTIGNQSQDPRNAKVNWIEPKESDNRDSDVVLEEEKEQTSPPPPQD